MNRFFKQDEQGNWQHWINDEQRATITEENLADYKRRGGYEDDPVINE